MKKFKLYIFITLLVIPATVNACAVCYGAVDSPMTNGMNMAILFLLGAIGFILLGVIALIFYFAHRAKLVNN